jgi:hypothetical protein
MGVQLGTSEEHRYQLCRDEYCDRFPCRVYREGYRNGAEDAAAEAYDRGFTDGIAACPGPHGGK